MTCPAPGCAPSKKCARHNSSNNCDNRRGGREKKPRPKDVAVWRRQREKTGGGAGLKMAFSFVTYSLELQARVAMMSLTATVVSLA